MTKAHKLINQDQFLLRRKLIVEGLDESQWDDFIHELNHHPCVDFAERKPNDQLQVTYDGTHWSMDELLAMIEVHGGRLEAGWWTRRKLAWYQFTDDNVRANAKHEPFCCSKIPPMKRK
ncbi:hypothetical protein [Marinobacter zhanjiangensis]|uniref:Uncharacterized protein n=1 Tax=Marinobacter zhanjiangensis TaxID=578215 RepID=A0ABQ3B1J4_9GAMM|nr:hypothetical protein [Marinobacter zhanjiangensis]GGY71160.1 hypothetical protein GCM10007071_17890 [Marinobacter zhanjiangensis]